MPGTLNVRNLDDELIARLRRRAARHGRSTEAEHREILKHALAGEAETDWWSLAADMRKLTAGETRGPAEALLREGREERSAWLEGSAGIAAPTRATPSAPGAKVETGFAPKGELE
jgi:plasmid stability protein